MHPPFRMYFAVMLLQNTQEGIYIKYRATGNDSNLTRRKCKTKVIIRELMYADDFDLVSHSEAGLHSFLTNFQGTSLESQTQELISQS